MTETVKSVGKDSKSYYNCTLYIQEVNGKIDHAEKRHGNTKRNRTFGLLKMKNTV